MQLLEAQEALIAWNPGTDQIRVGPLIERDARTDWTNHPIRYRFTGGAAYSEVREMDEERAKRSVLCLFNTLVIRDRVDPKAAHTALCGIRQFAESINLECPGAVEPADEVPRA